MAQGDASGRHAGTRRLRALSHIPGMADIHPREPNPLSPLQDNAGVPGGCRGQEVLVVPVHCQQRGLRPSPMEGGPVSGQLAGGQKTYGVPPSVRVSLEDEVHKLGESGGGFVVAGQLQLAEIRLDQEIL